MKNNIWKFWQHSFCYVLPYLFIYTANAQEFTSINKPTYTHENLSIGLNIGDQLPDKLIRKVINRMTSGPIRTSDYKNELLIIDFWATSCSGCVAALPKMSALQKEFKSKLAILPVTYENENEVKAFWKSNSYTKNLNLPSVVEDTLFSNLFRHTALPHEIWIYKNKVIGITGPEYIDAATIRKVLAGDKMNWPIKNDFYVFNTKQPIFNIDTNQIDSKSTNLNYVAICGYIEGVKSIGFTGGLGTVRDTAANTIRTYFRNMPIYNAYYISYTHSRLVENLNKPSPYFTPNQIVWEVPNRNLYQYQNVALSGYPQEWMRLHACSYESLKDNYQMTDSEVYTNIIKDLNLLFGLNVRWEKRNEQIYVLQQIGSANTVPSIENGFSSSNLVGMLNNTETNPYVFDESHKVVMLPAYVKDMSSITEINKIIKPYGLTLQAMMKSVDKLIFAEKENLLLPDTRLINSYNGEKAKENTLPSVSEADNKQFMILNKSKKGVKTLPSGLQYKIFHEGLGQKVTISDKVKVRLTGRLINGKIFQSSNSNGIPTILKISDVIPGLSEALREMNTGAKYEVYVPAKLGYGDNYYVLGIPKNSTVIFEIELLEIITKNDK